MDLTNLIAVSGMPGLFRMVGNRPNGIFIEEIDTGKRKFAPTRKHQFTPLESISIFTFEDATELTKVFQSMIDQMEDNPVPEPNSSSTVLREYFLDILPNHDPDRVHPSDIKKVIKWFSFLHARDLLNTQPAEASDEEE